MKTILTWLLLCGVAVAQSPTIRDGLVMWQTWENGNAVDRISSNNGTLIGSPLFPAGVVGRSISLDGSSQSVSNVGNLASFSFIQNTMVFTIATWLRSNSVSTRQVVLANANTSADKGVLLLFEHLSTVGTQAIRFVSYRGSLGNPRSDSHSGNNTLTDTRWHHVVVVGDGTVTPIYYIDGVHQTTTVINSSGPAPSGNTTRPTVIGRLTSGELNWNGDLDDFRIYNRALSAQEIAAIYNERLRQPMYEGD